MTLALMIVKSGLHSHPTVEFTPYQMARVVELTPIWLSASLLITLGTGLFQVVKTKQH
jgi:hypothetical protein